jgi:hypothetical protein
MTTTFSRRPMSQLLNRQTPAIRITTKRTAVQGHAEIPPARSAECRTSPPSLLFGAGVEPAGAPGEGVPVTTPGGADGLGELRDPKPAGDGDARGVAFAVGDGLGFRVGVAGLIV